MLGFACGLGTVRAVFRSSSNTCVPGGSFTAARTTVTPSPFSVRHLSSTSQGAAAKGRTGNVIMKADWTIADIPSLAGKTAVVTGANVGLGREITKRLAEKDALVIMACRTASKAEAAKKEILTELSEGKKIEVMVLDVSSMASVHQFVQDFKAKYKTLDLLMCNAGVMALDPRQSSVDGFEMQFATNHLGHFLLVGELMDVLKATPGSRVVNQSSSGSFQGGVNFDDLQAEQSYSRYVQYAMTKLSNVIFANELTKRCKNAGLSQPMGFSSHPGLVIGQLQANATSSWLEDFLYNKVFIHWANDYPKGALPALYALTCPEAEPATFYGPNGFYKGILGGSHPAVIAQNPNALDEEICRKHWEASEQLVKFKYGI